MAFSLEIRPASRLWRFREGSARLKRLKSSSVGSSEKWISRLSRSHKNIGESVDFVRPVSVGKATLKALLQVPFCALGLHSQALEYCTVYAGTGGGRTSK